MAHILIVGLPKGAGQLVDMFAKRAGLLVDRIYSAPGARGSQVLLPRPEHCLPSIQKYFDVYGSGSADYAGSRVIVLPYADVPAECVEELEVAESMGSRVEYPDPGIDPTWPKLSRRHGADQQFHVALARTLEAHLLPLDQRHVDPPAAFIAGLAEACPQLLIAHGALDTCDQAALHRHDFMRKAATALVDALLQGLSNRFDAHCTERGLHHAQSGGSKITVKFSGGGCTLQDIECYTHLKSGDKTTREAAARLYYTFFDLADVRHAAILYAGPHPAGDFTVRVEISV